VIKTQKSKWSDNVLDWNGNFILIFEEKQIEKYAGCINAQAQTLSRLYMTLVKKVSVKKWQILEGHSFVSFES